MNRILQYLSPCNCQRGKRIAERLQATLLALEERIELDGDLCAEFVMPCAEDIAEGNDGVAFQIFYRSADWPIDDNHAAHGAEIMRAVADDLLAAAERLEGGCAHV